MLYIVYKLLYGGVKDRIFMTNCKPAAEQVKAYHEVVTGETIVIEEEGSDGKP